MQPLMRWGTRLTGPGTNPFEGGLLYDQPSVPSTTVDTIRIPQPKQIVGPAGGGMQKVKGPRIDRQFFQHREIKVGLVGQSLWGLLQDRQGTGDELGVASVGHARTSHKQRYRSHSLMRIGLGEPLVLQHSHRPPAHIVVEERNRAVEDWLGIVKRPTCCQHGLGSGRHEEWSFQSPERLMLKQIAMEATVGLGQLFKGQREHLPCLYSVAKRRRLTFQQLETACEHVSHGRNRLGPLTAAHHHRRSRLTSGRLGQTRCLFPGFHLGEEFVHRLPHTGVKRPGGEVQIAEQGGCGIVGRLRRLCCRHRARSLRGRLDTHRSSRPL